jgi:perosamine synthetase
MVHLIHPLLDGNEVKYLTDCIQSSWVSSKGPFISQFEQSMAVACQVDHALAVSSGTAALHLALLAIGVGPGDEVLLPALTYIADANVVMYCGAKTVFVDIDLHTWNLDLSAIESKITPRTKAIIAVHLYGHPVDMDFLNNIASQHGIAVIEDACEAQGATYKERPVGSIGDIGCFSFYANKLITTGEGGMLVCNSDVYADTARSLCNQASLDDHYSYGRIGYNYRMSNLQAAIGLAQLERIGEFIAARHRLADLYTRALSGIPGIMLYDEPGWGSSVCWLFSVLIEDEYGISRDQLRTYLFQMGIESKPFFRPLPCQPMYHVGESFPNSEQISRCGISLPTSVDLPAEQIEFIARTIKEAPLKLSLTQASDI